MMSAGRGVAAVWVTVMFIALSASANLSFFTDRSAWETAVNSTITTETFNDITPYEFSEGTNPAGLITFELFNISGTSQWNSINNGSDVVDFLNIDGTHFFQGRCAYTEPDAMIKLILPDSVWALGGEFTSVNSQDGLSMQLNGLQYDLKPWSPAGNETGFLGFISDSPFSHMTFYDPVINDYENSIYRSGESFGLDNVSFAVPEPLTLSLVGLGILYLDRRRRVLKSK